MFPYRAVNTYRRTLTHMPRRGCVDISWYVLHFRISHEICTRLCFVLLWLYQWRHNKRDGVSNHRRLDCLLNRLFKHISKKTPNLRVTGLCERNSPVTGDSTHKGPVTRKMFPFDDVIMGIQVVASLLLWHWVWLFQVCVAPHWPDNILHYQLLGHHQWRPYMTHAKDINCSCRQGNI